MLVKFLSFVASILGTRRYKPILFACTVLLLTFTGFSVAQSLQKESAPSAASTVDQETDKPQSTSPQLSDSTKQKDTVDPDAPVASAPSDPSPAARPKDKTAQDGIAAGSTPAQPEPAFDIHTSASVISLSQDKNAGSFTATTMDNSEVEWSLTAVETNSNDSIKIMLESPSSSATLTVKVRLESPASPGSYRYVLTAKNVTTTKQVTKSILVTIN